MKIKFNSLKTRLSIALLLMVLLPIITIGWIANELMSEYIKADRIADQNTTAL